MAKVLKAWPASTKWAQTLNQTKYPWDKWFDGQIWQLTYAEDFDCKPTSFQATAHNQAKARGFKIATALLADDKAVIIQKVGLLPSKSTRKKPANYVKFLGSEKK